MQNKSNRMILCVEDNMAVQMLNKPLLEAKGFSVRLAVTLREAREILARETPCIIILDIHLPDGNGLDFLRKFRKTSSIPVIALTNNKEEQDILEGLQSGCDDYIPKPHFFPILYARIEAVLRRVEQMPETVTRGLLTLKLTPREAYVDSINLSLTPKDFTLLHFFIQNENRTMNAEYIYESVWGQKMEGDSGALSTAVSRLRKKLTGCGYTVSVAYGTGYCFERGEP